MAYRIVEYDNKSRKGQYVKVQYPGLPARVYKFRSDTKPEVYEKFYMDKYRHKKKGLHLVQYIKPKTLKVKVPKLKKTLKRVRSVSMKTVKKGVNSTVIDDVLAVGWNVDQYYKELLKPMVNDSDLLNIVATEHNMKKMKHRLEFRMSGHDKTGKKLFDLNEVATKTLREVVSDLKNTVRTAGVKIEDFSPTFKLELEKYGPYRFRFENNGTLNSIKCLLIFRKG